MHNAYQKVSHCGLRNLSPNEDTGSSSPRLPSSRRFPTASTIVCRIATQIFVLEILSSILASYIISFFASYLVYLTCILHISF